MTITKAPIFIGAAALVHFYNYWWLGSYDTEDTYVVAALPQQYEVPPLNGALIAGLLLTKKALDAPQDEKITQAATPSQSTDFGQLGASQVRLLAIYRQENFKAIVDVKNANSSNEIQTFEQGDIVGDIKVLELTSRYLTLQNESKEQLTLKLFKQESN